VVRVSAAADAPVEELVAGFNDAGFDLLRREPVEGNAVLSPASIGHAVLMARPAADDATGSAIDTALSLPAGVSPHEAWNAIDQAITAGNGTAQGLDGEPSPVVTIADRIWPATTARPDQDWVDLLAGYHGADVEVIDTSEPEASRRAINGWVSDRTETLIPELLPEGFITPDTVLVLTDAVYFEAQWAHIFGKYGEVEQAFHLLDGTTTPVTLLRDLEQPGPRAIGDGFAAIELPYLGGDYSMLVIIPDQGRYSEFRDGLSNETLAGVDAKMTTGPFELLMPKWQTTSSIDLLPWLTEIGAAPGIYPGIGPGVFLSGGVHGADIAVDEIGTVAAAATALGFDESGPPEPEIVIAADRPFLYVIRHVATGLALFVGQVTNPAA
jgi:serpin B